MRNVPRGLPLWSSQCIFQKPIQAPVSFNAGTSFQHTTHQRVASLTPPGSLQVAATILGGIFIKNTENNQFSPSNHQLYTGLQKIRVQLVVSQRSIAVSMHLQIYSTQYCSLNLNIKSQYQRSVLQSQQKHKIAVSEVWSTPINTATIDTVVQHHGNELCGIEWQRSRLKIITRISQIQSTQLIRVSSAHKLNHEGICMRLDWQTDGAVWQWNGKQNARNGQKCSRSYGRHPCSDTTCW